MKERFYVVASALSSYFGVGFNTIEEQLEIDLGHMEKEFDEEAQERMDLGNCMEEGCLNFFEKKLGIFIFYTSFYTIYKCSTVSFTH